MGRYPRTGRSERVAQRNRSTVDVQALTRQGQLALDSTSLDGECLVDFDEIHVVYRQSGFGESSLRGRYRSNSHHRWIDTGNTPRNQSAERLEFAIASKFFAGDHHRSCAVADPGRISSGDDSALSKHRLERRQTLGGSVGSHVFVFREFLRFARFGILHGEGNYFVIEDAFVPRRFRELLRSQREVVDASSIELVSLGQILRRLRHPESDE